MIGLVSSDTVLTVARALHVLAVVTEPGFVDAAKLREALDAAGRERDALPLACFRPAFVGFALLDANMHGLSVLRNFLRIDSTLLRDMEAAQLPQAIFPLCENEALMLHVVDLQEQMLKCWKERAAVPVNMDLPEHLALLERLWVAVGVQGKPFPGRSGKDWKELGFQRCVLRLGGLSMADECSGGAHAHICSDSPASDFRGMGILGLEQLVYYCETCTTEARVVFATQNAADADMYYPVATAGVIVSSLVLSAIEVRRPFLRFASADCFGS